MDTMKGLKRTHYCGEISQSDKEVVLAGFVSRSRDKGNLIFIDLRDRTGIAQLIFDDETDRAVFEKAKSCRSEFVVMAKGIVRRRESINPDLKTGNVELFVTDLRILSKAKTPPFEIANKSNVKEELRLKYRYLDLRRGELMDNIIMRDKITKVIRKFYDENGFIEIDTPILIRSTPEGARDFLVPSRMHKGSFFALPQSPQLYKQLLMLSGFDRYVQFAKCFRDEELRADRQPEFTQIDLEMSFVDAEDVITINEKMISQLFKEILDIEIPMPIPRITYADAMERYGSDKPDTRFEMELCNLNDVLVGCEFMPFASALKGGGRIGAINAVGSANMLSRKELDKLTDFAKGHGVKGLAWLKITDENTSSSFAKFVSEEQLANIIKATNAKSGDVVLIIADSNTALVQTTLGAIRCHMAQRLDIIPDVFNFCWIVQFPFFEYDKESDSYVAMHHPFTSPLEEDIPLLDTDKASVRADAYDLVLNGVELSSGSIRITDPELQMKMFNALGISDEEAEEKFGFLTTAFSYGAPPHGGMGIGLDRLVMLMLGCNSVRDVTAFPKVQNVSELMTNCPSEVDVENLNELGIKIVQK